MKNCLVLENYQNDLLLVASIILFRLTQVLRENIPLLDDIDDGKTVYTLCVIHFSSSSYHSTKVSTFSGLTINSASSPSSMLVVSTIGSQHTSEKEGAKYGGIYHCTVRGLFSGMLPNGSICL